jgi:hypothetical protein
MSFMCLDIRFLQSTFYTIVLKPTLGFNPGQDQENVILIKKNLFLKENLWILSRSIELWVNLDFLLNRVKSIYFFIFFQLNLSY